MDYKNIEQSVIGHLQSYLQDGTEINNTTMLSNLATESNQTSLEMISIEVVELMVELEDEFGIEFNFEENLNTVNDYVDYIYSELESE